MQLPKPRTIRYHILKLHYSKVVELLLVRLDALSNVSGTKRNQSLKLVVDLSLEMLAAVKGRDIDEPSIVSLLSFGDKLLGLGYSQESLSYYDVLTEVTKKHHFVIIGKANVLMATGDTVQAEQLYKYLIGKVVVTTEIRRRYVKLCKIQGNINAAISLYKAEIELKPNDINLHYEFADFLFSCSLFDDSEEQCLIVLRLDPQYGYALQILTKIYTRRKEFSQLQVMYLQLVDSFPNIDQYKIKLAGVYRDMKHYVEARELYNDVLRDSPDNCECLDGVADIAGVLEDFEEAETLYLKALSVQPDRYVRHMRLARIYYKQTKYLKSLDSLDEAIRLSPRSSFAQIFKANVLRKMRRYHDAITLSQSIVDGYDLDMDQTGYVKNGIGFSLMELYRNDDDITLYYEAERVLAEISVINPSSCCGLVFLYNERLHKNDVADRQYFIDKMEQYIQLAVNLDPGVKDLIRAKEILAEVKSL